MELSLVLRCRRPALNLLLLLLSVFTTPAFLRAQVIAPPAVGRPPVTSTLGSNQIVVPATGGGLSVAVNPVTNKIYIPSQRSLGKVNVIDGATNVVKAVPAGTNPTTAAVNPVTNKVYVTDRTDNTVTG